MYMRSIFFFAGMLPFTALFAQVPDRQTEIDGVIEQLVSDISEQGEAGLDYNELAEDLYELARNPLNLNQATEQELGRLHFLSAGHIAALLEHRRRYGSIKSIYELAYIYGWDRQLAIQTALFVQVGPAAEKQWNVKRMLRSGTHELLMRCRQQFPGSEAAYLGSPQAYYLRYRYQVKQYFSVGILAEKDAGEQFFRGTQPQGFDFYSGHAYLAPPKGMVTAVVLGDFRIQAGQGLAVWTGFAPAMGNGVNGFMKNARGLVISHSANESQFLRGAALQLKPHKRMHILLYGSYKRIDASLEEDSLGQALWVNTLIQSGLHRTKSEVARKAALGEWIAGTMLQYQATRFRLGITLQYTGLSSRLAAGKAAYQYYRFSGRQLLNSSLYYAIKTEGGFLFGEWAAGSNGGWACINGWQGNLSPLFRLALLQRFYSRRYHTFYATAPARYAPGTGEGGFSLSLQCMPFKRADAGLYADIAYARWLTYTQPFFSYRAECGFNLNYRPAAGAELRTQLRYRFVQKKGAATQLIPPAEDTRRWDIRLQVLLEPLPGFRLQLRADAAEYGRIGIAGSQWGYMLAQDILWKTVRGRVDLGLRYCLFQADAYELRMYSYERDLLYAFSVPMMLGRGHRTAFTLHIRVASFVDVYAKTAYTWRADMPGTPSERWELGLQTRWKWRNSAPAPQKQR